MASLQPSQPKAVRKLDGRSTAGGYDLYDGNDQFLGYWPTSNKGDAKKHLRTLLAQAKEDLASPSARTGITSTTAGSPNASVARPTATSASLRSSPTSSSPIGGTITGGDMAKENLEAVGFVAGGADVLSDTKWMGTATLLAATSGNVADSQCSPAESGPFSRILFGSPLTGLSVNAQGPRAKKVRFASPPISSWTDAEDDRRDWAIHSLHDLRYKASVSLTHRADGMVQRRPQEANNLYQRAADIQTWGPTFREADVRNAEEHVSLLRQALDSCTTEKATAAAAANKAAAAANKAAAAAKTAAAAANKAKEAAKEAAEAAKKAADIATKAAALAKEAQATSAATATQATAAEVSEGSVTTALSAALRAVVEAQLTSGQDNPFPDAK